MIKNDLREQGFSVEERTAKNFIPALLWAIFTLLLIGGTIIMIMAVVGWITPYVDKDSTTSRSPIDYDLNAGSVFIGLAAFVIFLLFYLGIRFVLTLLFCHDRYNSVKLKILESKAMPVCHCREALKVWQTVVIYTVPVVIVYVLMLRMSGFWFPMENIEYINFGFLLMLFFMSFFMAFDLALVAYVVFIKVKYRVDYISVDSHMYRITLYKETYVRAGGKKVKRQLKTSPVNKPERRKRMFVTMTTCLNPECENYSVELDKSIKICPLCEGRIYKAEVLQNVVTCLNKDCANYGQELKEELESCTICGGKTGRLSFKFVPHLAWPSVAVSLLSAAVFTYIFWLLDEKGIDGGPLYMLPGLLWFGCWVASVVMGFLSKNKWTLVIAVLSYYLAQIILEIII